MRPWQRKKKRKKSRKPVYKPGLVDRHKGRPDDHFSRKSITRFLQRPTRESITGRTDPCSLFGLAPSGVYRARPVARPAGELLPRRFTLTARAEAREAVCFLLHFPWPHGRWVLPITASCGARTFLPPDPDRARPAIIRPTSGEISIDPSRRAGKWRAESPALLPGEGWGEGATRCSGFGHGLPAIPGSASWGDLRRLRNGMNSVLRSGSQRSRDFSQVDAKVLGN